jgi:hypothetical protein
MLLADFDSDGNLCACCIVERRLEVQKYRMDISMSRVSGIFNYGLRSNKDREILGNSLFYYCCGRDPTPVAAFGANIPLYIYCDILGCGQEDFQAATKTLHERLEKLNFTLQERRLVDNPRILGNAKRGEIFAWKTQQDEEFYLAYIQNDAFNTYANVYYDKYNANSIKPLCICNCKNEFLDPNNRELFLAIETRIEFILGECLVDNKNVIYRKIGSFKYYGDFGPDDDVPFFKRRFWYFKDWFSKVSFR